MGKPSGPERSFGAVALLCSGRLSSQEHDLHWTVNRREPMAVDMAVAKRLSLLTASIAGWFPQRRVLAWTIVLLPTPLILLNILSRLPFSIFAAYGLTPSESPAHCQLIMRCG